MDFWGTVLVVLRRWYVAVPVFLVTIGSAGIVFLSAPTFYASTGTLVLTAPTGGSTVDPTRPRVETNPLLAFDSTLRITSSLLIASLSTPESAAKIDATGAVNSLQVSNGQLDGPFVAFKVESRSAEVSQATVRKLLDLANQDMIDRQTRLGAPRQTFINVVEVVPPTAPQAVITSRLRSAAVALALGLVVSLLSAYGFQSFTEARDRRRAGGAQPSDEPGAVVPVPGAATAAVPDRAAPPPTTVEIAGAAVPAASRPSPRPRPVPAAASPQVPGTRQSNSFPLAAGPLLVGPGAARQDAGSNGSGPGH